MCFLLIRDDVEIDGACSKAREVQHTSGPDLFEWPASAGVEHEPCPRLIIAHERGSWHTTMTAMPSKGRPNHLQLRSWPVSGSPWLQVTEQILGQLGRSSNFRGSRPWDRPHNDWDLQVSLKACYKKHGPPNQK